MTTGGEQLAAPPIDTLIGELVVSLSYAAAAYLEPRDGSQPDLRSAELACDVAAAAFERISPQLRPEDRSVLTATLTDVRMSIVRKRG